MFFNVQSNLLSDLENAVKNIVTKTAEQARDPDYMSPFALAAIKQGFGDFIGGKPDDITVLLARVSK